MGIQGVGLQGISPYRSSVCRVWVCLIAGCRTAGSPPLMTVSDSLYSLGVACWLFLQARYFDLFSSSFFFFPFLFKAVLASRHTKWVGGGSGDDYGWA